MKMKKYYSKKSAGGFLLPVWIFFLLPFVLQAQGGDRTRYYEQLTGSLLQQIKTMQDENARLAESVNILTGKVGSMEREYKRLSAESQAASQNYSAKIEALRSQNRTLENKLYSQDRKIQRLERLIRDVGNAAAYPAGKQNKKYQEAENNLSAGKDVEYVEHTVEKGHVLFNIAKAYRVKVQDIRRINKLKSDRLSIGQKLLIPIKKER